MRNKLLISRYLRLGLIGLGLASSSGWTQKATVNLGATVTGNQEQPKVLYIVPWKAPQGAVDFNQDFSSQLELVFSHVERVEFQRELNFRQQIAQQQLKQNQLTQKQQTEGQGEQQR